MGFPIVSHSFIIQNKSLLSNLKQILKELEEEGVLTKRESQQDFLGIKEVGYDYIFEE
ncbi:hypothetical protein [Chryseobacterium scophthalmum]|uniref:hypothetical protein n=1 Tax=Chryseobacterium scophthalmum TaxID=59733 RepID=UPI003D008E22